MKFLGGITPQKFFTEYWEKKPLLIRNAVDNIESFASFEEFKELAYEEDFESRIVYNNQGDIKVKTGPLEEKDFNDEAWTFLCHNLNTLTSDFFELQKKVNFIPAWAFDDVMGSYSKEGSTIGAHIDKYNVFILQGVGKRSWKLQENPDPTYFEDKELKILKNFNPNIEWELGPGDMIYIPSSVAHCGETIEESLSYSIGFKSLEDQTIIDHYLTDLLENTDTEDYLKLTSMNHQEDPNLIAPELIDIFFQRIKNKIMDPQVFKHWMISHLSSPKDELEKGEVLIEEEIINILKNHDIYRDNLTRFSSFKDENEYIVSINKSLYRLDTYNYELIKIWFENSFDEPISIDHEKLDNDSWPLLIDLFKNGTFYFN